MTAIWNMCAYLRCEKWKLLFASSYNQHYIFMPACVNKQGNIFLYRAMGSHTDSI